MTFKIGTCAGHGGFGVTPGKRTPDGEYEWNFNDRVLCAFISKMKEYEGVEVKRYDDPTGKTDVPLKTRTDKANADKVDIYISFHHNANSGKWGNWGGVETHVQTGIKGQALEMAQAVQPILVKTYGLRDRKIKFSDLHITRETKMPAILIEGGFMDSTTDISKLRSDAVLKDVGKGIADAIAKWKGLKKKATPKPTTPIKNTKPTEVKAKSPSIVYEAHVQGIGWQGKVSNGKTAGTTGQSKRLEALTVKLENSDAKIEMEAHVQGLGWTTFRTNGEVVGTIGESLRLEAVKIKAKGLDIQYRVHVEKDGWTPWKKNGEAAGTTGLSKRVEAIQIKLV
ncbi:N-acetylmuramoyl-L-alanine amidase [Niallia sp. FSL W8-0951]|uniref:N-acetylmuramoyl-L-alanine amidase n=1 Tax=Niallia sp. FSL W8-0951 TaxID=2954639 RepID=UPI0030F87D37